MVVWDARRSGRRRCSVRHHVDTRAASTDSAETALGRGHRRAERRMSKDAFRALGQCDREQSAWEEQAVADAQEKRDLRHFRQLPIGQLDVVVTTRLIVLPSRANWAGEPRAGQGLLVNRPIGRNIRLLTFVPVFL